MITGLVLPDGTEILSGMPGYHAVISATVTENTNQEQELAPGTVFSAVAQIELFIHDSLQIPAGTEFLLFRQDSQNNRIPAGIFLAEKPVKKSANRMSLTAYDKVSLLDQDVTGWFAGLTGWPYSVCQLAQMVCRQCGLTLHTEELLCGDYYVNRFTVSALTGRQLMQWICQIGGVFCRADGNGELYLGWFRDRDTQVTPSGSCFYYQGSLRREDYSVEPVGRVCLRRDSNDVGVSFPENNDGNCYVLQGNPLLGSGDSQSMQQIAQMLYERMSAVCYTPCSVTVPADSGIAPGDSFTVTDGQGDSFPALAMSVKTSGSKMTVACTGSIRRDSSSAKSYSSYHTLSGKVMNLQANVDGIKARIENVERSDESAHSRITELKASADGVSAKVTRLEYSDSFNQQMIADIDAKADGIALQVSSVEQIADRAATDSWYALTQSSQLQLTANGITAEVNRQSESVDSLRKEMTAVKQTAEAVKISVESMEQNGTSRVQTETGYTFGADGLRIKKAGQEMENKLDETGMTVSRGSTVMLSATKDGVSARDVSVRNYLIVGDHARFEDYGENRTACFYL